MSCPKDTKKAIVVTEEKGGGVLPPNLEQVLAQQIRRVEVKNAEKNELQLKIQELRANFPQKQQDPELYGHLINHLMTLEPTDENFQMICAAIQTTTANGAPACPELLTQPLYFILALKFKDKLPASWQELRGEGELGQDLRDFQIINFCETILAAQEGSPIQNKIKQDLVALATAKTIKNWHYLNTVYPSYWMHEDHQTAIAQILPFLATCPAEIKRARQAMTKLENQDQVVLLEELLLSPNAEEQITRLENEQAIRQERWLDQKEKVIVYQNFCDFIAHYANEEDEVIQVCLRNFIKDPQLSADEKRFYTSCLAMIMNNRVDEGVD